MSFEISRGADGMYAVCFKNYKAYSEEKIWEVFGRYGRVSSVRFSGTDTNGMVFVRYSDYDETKNCLEDMTKTKELSVKMALSTRPHGPKQQSGNVAKPSTSHQVSEDNRDANYQNSGSNYSGFRKNFHTNFKQNNGQKRFFNPKPKNYHPKNENFSVNHKEPRQNGEQNVAENEVPKDKEPLKGEMLNGYSEHRSKVTAQVRSNGPAQRKAIIRSPGCEDGSMYSNNRGRAFQVNNTSSDFDDEGPPPLAGSVDFRRCPDFDDEGPPPLAGSVDFRRRPVERPKVYAKDVVIGNLPPQADVIDVIQLARRLEITPVHVSPIERTSRHNLPFCRVWLKNEYDAQIMEFELKGSFMGGKKLLVARAEKLLNGSV
ncbi:uncharacterized protein LOC110826564 isoform X3 [Zootermopsis nevadensis]|uniref:RRM domain-containing protein n=1 Tax=Zootermopsis nevadensis TaxID=136037 RepID=A0A067RFU1_ZOONE|nr:uncharacterized protein LOC110826564 isoform X2 [Zootermopsis nevadensis]XP_021913006.1 uncharacterized protein LOC110826564 isoform X3 [Zootermopsis nevadensis]KDR22726.1 hypothetical protein L798_14972 [Zootermopsis nevadensis]